MTNTVRIRFFASLREALGCAELAEPLAAPCQVRVLLLQLATRPELQHSDVMDRDLLVAVNHQLVGWDHWVQAGDEVAFFPPVTGG